MTDSNTDSDLFHPLGNGYSVFLRPNGDGWLFVDGVAVPSVHIITDEAAELLRRGEFPDEWGTSALVGGFFQTMKVIKEMLIASGIKRVEICAIDERRMKAFSRWAIRQGAEVRIIKDACGDDCVIAEI